MNYKFKDLIDVPRLQELTDELYRATGIPSAIIGVEGEILTGSGWQRICTHFHRKHPQIEKECIESDTRIREGLDRGEPFVMYKCPRGLVDASSPVIIEGEHVANVFTGQLFNEPPDSAVEEHFRRQAKYFGFDEEAYMAAFREIPVMSEQKYRDALQFLARLARLLAHMGLVRKRELEVSALMLESEARYRTLFESSMDAIMTLEPPAWRFTSGNPAAVRLFGARDEAEFTAREPWTLSPERQPDGRASGEKAREMIEKAMAEGSHFFEWTHRRVDGREFPATVLLTRLECGGMRFLQATVRDVSRRKASEKALQQSELELRRLLEASDRSRQALLSVAEDQQQAEARLLASEARYRELVENLNDVIFATDAGGVLTFASPALERVTGYRPEEAVGRPFAGFIHPEDLKRVRTAFADLARGRMYPSEYRLVAKSGGLRWVNSSSRPVFEKGVFAGIQGRITDVTERKQAEESLRESEEQFRLLVANSPDMIMSEDLNGNTIYLSDQAEAVTGYSVEELIRRRFDLKLYHPDDLDLIMAARKQGKEGKEIVELEYRFIDPNGEIRWLSHTARPVRTDGQMTGIQSTVRNITGRKAAEEALRRSEKRFRMIVDNMNDAYYLHDFNGRILDCNENACRMLGYGQDELVGAHLSLIDGPGNRALMAERMDRLAAEGWADFDGEHVRKDGRLVPVMISVRVVSREGDGVLQSLVRDMTERKKVQDQLLQSAKLSVLGTLAAGMAHEINNPNMSIMLNASFLEERLRQILARLEEAGDGNPAVSGGRPLGELKEEIAEAMGNLHHGAQRIKLIVAELANYVKEQPPAPGETVDVNRVVESAVQLTWNRIKNATDRFSFTPGPGLPSLPGNPQQVEQVMVNLLVNACDALSERNQAISISTRHDPEHGRVVIRVRDEGVGMPPEILEKIKMPFFTTKKTTDNMGLGVPISTRLIEQVGGTLEYESAPGQGTTAIVTLLGRAGG